MKPSKKEDHETWCEYESRVNSYYEDAEDYGDLMLNMEKEARS